MKHIRRIPLAVIPVFFVLAGLAAVIAGVYLLAGLPVALIAGGCLSTAGGLLADL